jgi:hypothetical protein
MVADNLDLTQTKVKGIQAGGDSIDYRCEDRKKVGELGGSIGVIRKVLIPSFRNP